VGAILAETKNIPVFGALTFAPRKTPMIDLLLLGSFTSSLLNWSRHFRNPFSPEQLSAMIPRILV
jgi:hypothetical protein